MRLEMVTTTLGNTMQLGTGHAALMAKDLVGGHIGPLIIAAGDTPLLQSDTFVELTTAHEQATATITLATSLMPDPKGYGRIVRDSGGEPVKIVEEKDAGPDERAIHEINVGLYCFDCPVTLFRVLPTLSNTNSQGEYYLTDVLEVVQKEGGKLAAKIFDDPSLTVGVNDRWQLALLAAIEGSAASNPSEGSRCERRDPDEYRHDYDRGGCDDRTRFGDRAVNDPDGQEDHRSGGPSTPVSVRILEINHSAFRNKTSIVILELC